MEEARAFCVQYHPEAGPGPHDARYLFDAFVALCDGESMDGF
jgi:carbamoyl-phosphate synthase small subunit